MHRRAPYLTTLLAIVIAIGGAATVEASQATPRIVGGTAASIGDWPFIAALVSRGDDAYDGQFCGGTLIAPTLVLTAAHCVDGKPFDVVLGKQTLSGTGGERIQVTNVALPPGYDAARNLPDVAVLQLASPATEVPLAIAAPGEDGALTAVGAPLSVAGWGLTAQQPDASPDALRSVAIKALSSRDCTDAYGSDFRSSLAICADGGSGHDSCQGDSGGPLVGNAGAGLRLVGVVSFGGQTCGDPDQPGVYARVASQSTWLDGLLGGAGVAVPAPTPAPAANLSTIKIRFGTIACDTSRCHVDLKTSGPVKALTGALVVEVKRGGSSPVDRVALARKVATGLYRAFVDLPFGTLKLSAYGVDADAKRQTKTTRTTITVTS